MHSSILPESKCGLKYSELHGIKLLQYSSVELKDHILDYISDCETNSTSRSNYLDLNSKQTKNVFCSYKKVAARKMVKNAFGVSL